MKRTTIFVVLAATLLVGMAIAASVSSPMLRDRVTQTSIGWFGNITQQHIARTLGTSAPFETTAQSGNSSIADDLDVLRRQVMQHDKPTRTDAKPISNDTDYENIALQHIAQTHGLPAEELIVGSKVRRHLRMIDRKVWKMNILMEKWNLNKGPEPMYEVFIDMDGSILDNDEFSDLKAQDQRAHREKYGKLRPSLYDHLQSMQPNEMLRVIIDVKGIDSKGIEKEVLSKYLNIEIINYTDSLVRGKYPNFSTERYPNSVRFGLTSVTIKDGELNRTEIRKIEKEIHAAKKEAYALKEKPLIDYLTAKGYDARGSSGIPSVYATLPKEEIIVLQERDDVFLIWRSIKYELQINTAVPTIRANEVWSEGFDGTGVKIAIVEPDGVDFSNPHLHGYMRPGQTDVGSHATQCAGVAASDNSTFRGVAYNATILSANADSLWDYDLIDAAEWAIAEGAEVLSCSVGRDTGLEMDRLDRFFDKAVYENHRSVVIPSGNSYGNVTSPGLGWNVMTVGGIDDGNNADWSDDDIDPQSGYIDPPETDRNKPEVCAVSMPIRSTETEEYFNENGAWITKLPWLYTGTSYAAPAVAGEIALLSQCFIAPPETLKAVVMASAIHNTYNDTIDDKEGVGTVDVSEGWKIIYGYEEPHAGNCSVLPYTSMPVYFNAVKGEKVRFAISWCSHTDWDNNESYDVLETNFSLYIYDSQNNRVGYSISNDNSYEVVDFTAPVSGEYVASTTHWEGDEAEGVGYAWSRISANSDFNCPEGVDDTSDPVQFTDESTGEIASRAWDFDNDGEVDSYEQNPVHYYDYEGVYDVSLAATGSGSSCKEIKYDCVRVGTGSAKRPLVDADFSASPRVGTPPLTVKFNDTSSSEGEINSWKWNFGDGTPLNYERNPQHTYDDIGHYDISLEVTNTDGAKTKEMKFDYIEVRSDVTIYVDTGGWWYEGEPYNPSSTPIDDAVNHASAYATIIVKDGTYHENAAVEVDIMGLTIQSENGPDNCVVQMPCPYCHVFEVTADYTNMVGFTVTGADGSDKAGIYLSNADHCTIYNNVVLNNDWWGIYSWSSDCNTFTSNIVNSNDRSGIYLHSSSNNILTGNTANSNGWHGIDLYSSNHNTLKSNTVNSNYWDGIFLKSSSNNILTSNIVNSNGFYGIDLYSSSNNNTLTSNTVDLNGNGIVLRFSSNSNMLTSNTANSNCWDGIYMDSSSSNTLTSNTVLNNEEHGIELYSSGNGNTLTGNTVNSNYWDGIVLLYSSSNNTLTGNTANSNGWNGICLDYSSNDNTLQSNIMNSNTQYGIYVYHSSNDNLIYNNYFNNTDNAWDNGNNIWDTTKREGTNILGGNYLGGNYWSDYAGEDLDGDGLGDTLLPYNSGGGITNDGDRLPLVLPMCGDIDGDREIDTVDLLILLEYVVTGTSVDVCVGDIDGNGHINSLDVLLLMDKSTIRDIR